MRSLVQLKKPYGKGVFSRVRNARHLAWEDAFDVEFADGLSFLEPHSALRKANRISARAVPVCVSVDKELGSHFSVAYDTGEVAEVWSPGFSRPGVRIAGARRDLGRLAG